MPCFWMTVGSLAVVGLWVVFYFLCEKCPVCGARGSANSLRDPEGRLQNHRCGKCGWEWMPVWVAEEREEEEKRRK